MRTPYQLRPAVLDDESFLLSLYASTRQEELVSWGWDEQQTDTFLKMQWQVQRSAYATRYPEARQFIVLMGDSPIGRFIHESTEEIDRLIDIALLPDYRGRGIGTAILHELLSQAQQRSVPLVINVFHDNPARRLYERLGFRYTGVDAAGLYLAMCKMPESISRKEELLHE